jgi:hypothetical protein
LTVFDSLVKVIEVFGYPIIPCFDQAISFKLFVTLNHICMAKMVKLVMVIVMVRLKTVARLIIQNRMVKRDADSGRFIQQDGATRLKVS